MMFYMYIPCYMSSIRSAATSQPNFEGDYVSQPACPRHFLRRCRSGRAKPGPGPGPGPGPDPNLKSGGPCNYEWEDVLRMAARRAHLYRRTFACNQIMSLPSRARVQTSQAGTISHMPSSECTICILCTVHTWRRAGAGAGIAK